MHENSPLPEEPAPGAREINLWQGEYTVRAAEVDARSRLSIPALCNILQEAAGEHAAQFKISAFDLLRDHNCTWVLSRLHLKMERHPGWKDTIRVRTWPSDIERLVVLRDFQVSDTIDRVIANAVTAWIIIDAGTRRPVRPQRFLEQLRITSHERVFNSDFKKLPGMAVPERENRFPVRYSDIDMNRHVNNVCYIEWALESVPPEVLEARVIAELEIHFLAEALFGEEVIASARRVTPDDSEFLHGIVRAHDGQELVRARTIWMEP